MDDRSVTRLSEEDAWHVATRWQALDGEYRANHLRIVCIVSFYVVHLLQHYRPLGVFVAAESPERVFHLAVTMIAAAWLLLSLAVDLSLRQRLFPKFTAYSTTLVDVVFLTAILALGGGQQSPLVLGYALILVLAALRISLPLVRAATAVTLLAYLYLMVMGRWPALFGDRLIAVVPRYAQVMTLLAIAMSGVMLGQLIRRFHLVAMHYAALLGAVPKGTEAEKGRSDA